MPRATMPLFLALVGMLAAAGLAMSRYTDLMAGASADTEIYNLIAGAAGAPLEGDGVRTGTSSLPFVPVAPTDTTAEPVARDTIATQPREWVAAAARADREALAGWLGPLVMASAGPRSADTFGFTLRRLTLHHGCPLVATFEASEIIDTSGEGHLPRLVRLRSDCPRVEIAP
ncbi:MAG: hypothetical protein U0133_22460 [Gemmatimonadales bacterium]